MLSAGVALSLDLYGDALPPLSVVTAAAKVTVAAAEDPEGDGSARSRAGTPFDLSEVIDDYVGVADYGDIAAVLAGAPVLAAYFDML